MHLISWKVDSGSYWEQWSKGQSLSESLSSTYVVLHNMLSTHQGGPDRAPTRTDDIAAQQNEQVLYVPDENYRNPLREARHQRDLLKDYFNYLSASAGQDRIWEKSPVHFAGTLGVKNFA